MRPTPLPAAPRGRLRLTSEGLAWFVAAAVLPALGAVECSEFRSYLQRGRQVAPPIIIGSAFPFGFLRFECIEASEADLVVLPALGQADVDGLRRWLLRQAGTEGRSRKVLRRV